METEDPDISEASDPSLESEEEYGGESEKEGDTAARSQGADDMQVDMSTGLAAVQVAMDLMNRNRFTEAEDMLKPWVDKSIYHSTANSTILFLQAVFSMEQEAIEKATAALNDSVALCDAHRKARGVVETVSSWVFGTRMDAYTPEELQAEVLFAENNLLLSLITFLQDESLMSFIKGGLRIRSSHSLYKQLYQWLEVCEKEGMDVEPNFATGVRMGMGTFNLFLSLLPGRVLRLLEFVGFSGERDWGLELLEAAAQSWTFRGSISTSFLLCYYTVASVMMGIGNMDPSHSEKLVRFQLEKYPDAAQFLYFQGRVELMRGNVDGAITCFQRVHDLQKEWKQIHHLCWWELMWCFWLKADWEEASSYADQLYHNSKWSKSTFLYQQVGSLLMLRSKEKEQDIDPATKLTANITYGDIPEKMKLIPLHKQRIAGKSLPIEKFAVAKSERYLQQSTTLPLPALIRVFAVLVWNGFFIHGTGNSSEMLETAQVLEILYAWNGFRLLARNSELLRNMMKYVWEELMRVEESRDSNSNYTDDWCVVTLIQGVCFRAQKRHDEAQHCFEGILERAPQVQFDHYTVAAACMELGLLYVELGKLEEAEKQLQSAKNDYKGYHLESRIHFRIHAGLRKISRLKTQKA